MTIYEFIDDILANHDGYNTEIIEYCNEQELNAICAVLDGANATYSLHTDLRSDIGNRHILSKSNITDFVNITYIKLGV